MKPQRASLVTKLQRDEQKPYEPEVRTSTERCCARCRRGTPALGHFECGLGYVCGCHSPEALNGRVRSPQFLNGYRVLSDAELEELIINERGIA